jgi:glycine hydroxymethyltransferase
MHVIAAKAVAFGEALQPEFKSYAQSVVANAKALAESLKEQGARHRLRRHGQPSDAGRSAPEDVTGKAAEAALGRANITCNKNGIPFDPEKPFVTSGIRLGTPAGTTRGFGQAEFREIGTLIARVLDGLRQAGPDGDNSGIEEAVKKDVIALTERFPIYSYLE